MSDPQPTAAPGRPLRILIVEDEILVAMAIEAMVASAGHDPIALAIDLATAVDAVDADQPDLALVDVQLAHGCSGIDVAGSLRARGIPVVFVTGNCPAAPAPDIAIGCLQKPVTEHVLGAALDVVATKLRGGTPGPIPPALQLY